MPLLYLNHIKNTNLRDTILKYFQDNEELITLRPTSITGEGAPADEDIGGGLILHGDRLAHYIVKSLVSLNLDSPDLDILIAAAYLHDIGKATKMGYKKYVFNFNGQIVRGYELRVNPVIEEKHAIWSAREASKIIKGTVTQEQLEKFYNIVLSHMGERYKDPKDIPKLPTTDLEKWFAYLDYMVTLESIVGGVNLESE